MDNTTVASYSFLNSSYEIKGNEFSNIGVIGLQLYSIYPWVTFNMPTNVSSVIKDNSFQANSYAPVIMGVRMNHVDVYDIVISGNCAIGILAGLDVGAGLGQCEDWSIKDNDLSDLIVSHPEGITIELNYDQNCEVQDNANQVVGDGSAGDPRRGARQPDPRAPRASQPEPSDVVLRCGFNL